MVIFAIFPLIGQYVRKELRKHNPQNFPMDFPYAQLSKKQQNLCWRRFFQVWDLTEPTLLQKTKNTCKIQVVQFAVLTLTPFPQKIPFHSNSLYHSVKNLVVQKIHKSTSDFSLRYFSVLTSFQANKRLTSGIKAEF